MKKISSKKHIIKIQKEGYTIIKNFLSKSEILLLKKKIKTIKKIKNIVKSKTGIWHLHNYDKFFVKIMCKKKIQKILIPLLNDPFYKTIKPNLPNYILGESVLVNDQSPLNLHLDSYLPSSSRNLNMANMFFLLNDRSKKNGCTIVVKKTHRKDSYPNRKNKNHIYLEGKCGDLIILDSRLWHGRSESITKIPNDLLVYIVQSWFIKQRFDYTHLLPKKIFMNLNNLEKQFMGFCSIPPKENKKVISIRQGYEVLKKLHKN